MMRVNLSVDQKHINDGMKRSCSQCPVALALHDQFPGKLINVLKSSILIYHFSPSPLQLHRRALKLPRRLKDFIRNFDNSQQVKPTFFQIDFEFIG